MGVSIPDKTGYEKIGNQKIGNQKTEHKNIELLSHPLQKINIRSMFLQNGGLQMEDCKWRIAHEMGRRGNIARVVPPLYFDWYVAGTVNGVGIRVSCGNRIREVCPAA